MYSRHGPIEVIRTLYRPVYSFGLFNCDSYVSFRAIGLIVVVIVLR